MSDTNLNPVLVEVTRGPMIESRHRGAAAVLDPQGRVIAEWGDIARPIYPRSAIKPVQAIPLIESGAAAAFELSDAEIALACASHNGEPNHIETVGAWLARLGLSENDLECGGHLPYSQEAAASLIQAGQIPSALYNNCSGKHTGMLTIAKHLGLPTERYVAADHPVQRMWRDALAEMTGEDLSRAPIGTDGCSIPTAGISLHGLALSAARFAAPETQRPKRAAAIRRIAGAITAEPAMIAGTKSFCSRVIAATGGQALVKTGAEGVYWAALPGRRLGFAVKIDDGATRASEVATAALLLRFGDFGGAARQILETLARPPLTTRRGALTGEIRPAADWLDGTA